VVSYSPSPPLRTWLGPRRAAIDVLGEAHAGYRRGGTCPPLAHAYVLRIVAEFQGFARDLHDTAVHRLVVLAGPLPEHTTLLVSAASEGRILDRGNPGIRSLGDDFRRLGLPDLERRVGAANPRWGGAGGRRGDRAHYADLLRLRNALAHGNDIQIDALRERGVRDTVTWARSCLPALNRLARALDRITWGHLVDVYGERPW
jgi:hypothetical protein